MHWDILAQTEEEAVLLLLVSGRVSGFERLNLILTPDWCPWSHGFRGSQAGTVPTTVSVVTAFLVQQPCPRG